VSVCLSVCLLPVSWAVTVVNQEMKQNVETNETESHSLNIDSDYPSRVWLHLDVVHHKPFKSPVVIGLQLTKPALLYCEHSWKQ